MANDLLIGADFMASLREYAQGVNDAAQEATYEGIAELVSDVRQRAATDAQWAKLAGNITVWSQDGRLWLGVQDQALLSEAMDAEYGTAQNPPSPLLRGSEDLLHATSQSINAKFNKHMGYKAL